MLSHVVSLQSYRVEFRAEDRNLRHGVAVWRMTVARKCRDFRTVVVDVDETFAIAVRRDNVILLDATLDGAPGDAELEGCLVDG